MGGEDDCGDLDWFIFGFSKWWQCIGAHLIIRPQRILGGVKVHIVIFNIHPNGEAAMLSYNVDMSR